VTSASQPGSEIYRVAVKEGIPVVPLRMRTPFDPCAIMKCMWAIRKNSVDLVHTHSSVDSWCCSIAAKLLSIPVVRSRHISAPISTNFFSHFLYMRLADQIFTSGETIRQTMIRKNGYDPQKIISNPAGVDEERFSPKINADYIRRDSRIGKDDFLLGIVAMLRNWKGHRYLLESIKALGDKIPNIKVLITGKGPQERNIRNYIRDNGLTKKVTMMGYREDVPQILRSLDLFVLPSYSNEGIPQGILQAMAMGIPVISTPTGGIGEVVRNGQTGMLVAPRSARALSEAIYWAYRNREETVQMAHKARELILKKYTLAMTIAKTEQVYWAVLESSRREKIPTPQYRYLDTLSLSSKLKKDMQRRREVVMRLSSETRQTARGRFV